MTETPPQSLARAAGTALGFVSLYVIAYFVGMSFGAERYLFAVGIRPMNVESLHGIFFSQFGHANFDHIFINALQLFAFATVLLYYGTLKNLLLVSAILSIGAGLFTWLLAPSNMLVVGASGLTSGLIVFTVFTAFLHKNYRIAVFASVWFAIVLVDIIAAINSNGNSAWQAHIGGLLFGVILVCIQEISRRRSLENPQLQVTQQ